MPFRFRKSIKVAPGVRMNLSKSGVSGTFGPRGASVGVGKRGTHANVGIPGTGISYRQRLDTPQGRAQHIAHEPLAEAYYAQMPPRKSAFWSYALWLIFGAFGIHRLYLGRTASGLLMLVLTVVGFAFPFTWLISGPWWLVDLFLIPRMR